MLSVTGHRELRKRNVAQLKAAEISYNSDYNAATINPEHFFTFKN